MTPTTIPIAAVILDRGLFHQSRDLVHIARAVLVVLRSRQRGGGRRKRMSSRSVAGVPLLLLLLLLRRGIACRLGVEVLPRVLIRCGCRRRIDSRGTPRGEMVHPRMAVMMVVMGMMGMKRGCRMVRPNLRGRRGWIPQDKVRRCRLIDVSALDPRVRVDVVDVATDVPDTMTFPEIHAHICSPKRMRIRVVDVLTDLTVAVVLFEVSTDDVLRERPGTTGAAERLGSTHTPCFRDASDQSLSLQSRELLLLLLSNVQS